ncbi:MAG TPA: complex I NDUFA9 subunit family protein [Gemmatimonadota bacterium]|nr:complex I NDUFA9 subunit family protein [Gemmatimonadota bacterium]
MILVTGATGFVGSEILRRASLRGWRVRGLARHPDRAEALGRLPHVELFRGDVTDPGELDEAMEGVTAVVHLVAIIAATREQGFEEVNLGGTVATLDAASRAGVPRFVHMSALGVEEGRDVTEYFRTKWEAEEAVRKSGLSTTVFRPSTIFGRDSEFFRLLATALRWSPGAMPLPGGGRQRLQPVWVGDVAECFLQAAGMERSPEPAYEVGGPEVLELRDIVGALAAATGRRRPLIVPLPVGPLKALAGIGEKVLPRAPVTADQLRMLELGSVVSPGGAKSLLRDFEIEHARLAEKVGEGFP